MAEAAIEAAQMDMVEAEQRPAEEAMVTTASTEAGLPILSQLLPKKVLKLEKFCCSECSCRGAQDFEVTTKADIAMVKAGEERPLEATTEEVVTEMTPATNVPSTHADEGGPSWIVSSHVAEAATESVQEIPPSSPQDIATSLRAALVPLASCSANILGLVAVPILLVATAKIADKDISFGPITGPYATLIQVLVN